MGSVLALDIGEKRVGIAASDVLRTMAFPVCVLPLPEVIGQAASFRRVLEDHEPDLLVSGLPLSLDGEEGPQAARIREVAAKIEADTGLPLEFCDERLSSNGAKRAMREAGLSEKDARGKVDMVAASLFLQTWLDAQASSASKR